MERYRDDRGNIYEKVGSGDPLGCGCLLGGILVIGVIGAVLIFAFGGAAWVGIHVYSYFNDNNAPGAYENRPDFFYGAVGLLFILSVCTVLATVVALFSRTRGAIRSAVVLFVLAAVAFVATVITHNLYMH